MKGNEMSKFESISSLFVNKLTFNSDKVMRISEITPLWPTAAATHTTR